MGKKDYLYSIMKDAMDAKYNGDDSINKYLQEQLKAADPKIKTKIKKSNYKKKK